MKIICVGRNYVEHIKELNNKTNDEPVIFSKPETALLQPRLPFFIPEFSQDIHHEVELVLKINKTGKNIAEKFANKYFDEISVGIDFTARDKQTQLKEKGLPWELAKAFDGSAPVGKFLSKEKLLPLDNIKFTLLKNNVAVQQGNSSNMIFSFSKIISFVSQYITLKKGDLIFTGTPKGVSVVKPNDILEAFIGDEKLLSVKVK
jgi:2-keto-4-pentenoate hydratase/2-oxohepta-3-ene-1,7-dioic acid hydratase in catechol pathway